METMYLIKTTYQSGNHTGKTFYLGKGGYVVDYEGGYCFYDMCYESLRAAKMVATKWTKESKRRFEQQQRDNERRAAQGKATFNCFELEVYEVFPVEFGY